MKAEIGDVLKAIEEHNKLLEKLLQR